MFLIKPYFVYYLGTTSTDGWKNETRAFSTSRRSLGHVLIQTLHLLSETQKASLLSENIQGDLKNIATLYHYKNAKKGENFQCSRVKKIYDLKKLLYNWYKYYFIKAVTKSERPNNFLSAPKMVFFSVASCKKDAIFGAARKMFGIS